MPNPISQAADAILDLVNSKPQSPTHSEIAALITLYWPLSEFQWTEIADLRQRLIGGVEGAKAGRDLTKWAQANDRYLRKSDQS